MNICVLTGVCCFDANEPAVYRPTHILYEFLPGQPLIVNPMLFMLAIFLAAGAFKKYHTVEQVLAVRSPVDQRYWVLEWADHVRDLPVFPEVSIDGPSEKIQTGTAFSTQLRGLSLRGEKQDEEWCVGQNGRYLGLRTGKLPAQKKNAHQRGTWVDTS